MNIFRFTRTGRPGPNAALSPEAMIEARLEDVRARANLLKAERALFDILAALLAAIFLGCVLRRIFPGAAAVTPLLALAVVCFSAFRALAARRGWTGRDGAAEPIG